MSDALPADPLAPPPTPSSDERQWGMLAHLLTLLGYLVVFGHFIPPLVIWLAKRDQSGFAADQAKESLNFQITVLILRVVCLVLVCCLVGILLFIPLEVAQIVLVIVASVQASDGQRYRYPLTLRMIA